jgi:hypothetical protein
MYKTMGSSIQAAAAAAVTCTMDKLRFVTMINENNNSCQSL